MEPRLRWHICATKVDFIDTATLAIARCAKKAIATTGSFRIVLAGGTTPRLIYEAVRDIAADWGAWHIYFGDERCLPMGDSGLSGATSSRKKPSARRKMAILPTAGFSVVVVNSRPRAL